MTSSYTWQDHKDLRDALWDHYIWEDKIAFERLETLARRVIIDEVEDHGETTLALNQGEPKKAGQADGTTSSNVFHRRRGSF